MMVIMNMKFYVLTVLNRMVTVFYSVTPHSLVDSIQVSKEHTTSVLDHSRQCGCLKLWYFSTKLHKTFVVTVNTVHE
jgi:hypothetical protein